jgi:hypothetical protein
MLEQMLESFLGSEHGRGATEALQQQGVPQSRVRQILSEALAAHDQGGPQAASGHGGTVMPFITRFIEEHLGHRSQGPAQRGTTAAGQAKLDANAANKGIVKGTTPEGQAKLDANRKAKGVGVGATPFEKQPSFEKQPAVVSQKGGDYGQKPQAFGKPFPQK